MKLFELYQKNTQQGTDNLKLISEAVDNKSGTVIKAGNTPVKLGINSSKYILGLYETAVSNGTSEQFLENLANLKTNVIMENDNTMRHIVGKYKHEVKNFLAGDDLDSDLYEALFDYYSDHGEMPYGIAKARDGDPYEWVTMRFDQDAHDYTGSDDVDVPALPSATMPSMARSESMYESKKMKQGVAEGSEEKVAQLKKDHDTAVHWSKNETSPQKREAARQKAEKIKRHLETQYKQGVAEGWDEMMAATRARADAEKQSKGTGKFNSKQTSTGTVYSRKYNADTGQSIETGKDAEGKTKEKRSVGRPNSGISGADESGTKFTDYGSWYHKSKRTHADRKIVGSKNGAVAVTPKGAKFLVVGKWTDNSGTLINQPKELLTLDDLKAFKSARGRPKNVREWIETLRYVAEGETTKTATGIKHTTKGKYGASEDEKEAEGLSKSQTSRLDKSMGIKHDHGNKKK